MDATTQSSLQPRPILLGGVKQKWGGAETAPPYACWQLSEDTTNKLSLTAASATVSSLDRTWPRPVRDAPDQPACLAPQVSGRRREQSQNHPSASRLGPRR